MNLPESLLRKFPEAKIIQWFRIACTAEAISCFLLYCVAMVWKHSAPDSLDAKMFMRIIGSFHGVCFIFYLLTSLPAKKVFRWDLEDYLLVLFGSIFPFASIWVEIKLAKKDRK